MSNTNTTTTPNYTPAPLHPTRPQLKGSGDTATDQRTGVAQLNEWALLDEREGHVPHDLNSATYGLVHLAQRCAERGVKVRLDTRPGLRLAIDAAKAALATIEEELLLRYERVLDSLLEIIGQAHGLTVPMVITYDGLIIEGLLVNESRYLQQWATQFANLDVVAIARQGGHTTLDQYDDFALVLKKHTVETYRRAEKARQEPTPASQFIHMKDVKITGADGTTRTSEFWRGYKDGVTSLVEIKRWAPLNP